MAYPEQILNTLERLALAFSARSLEPGTIHQYIEHLQDIPGWLLEKTAGYLIEHERFFPRISELRQAAARLENTYDFASLPLELEADALAAQAQLLQDRYYLEQCLEPAEWLALAEAFEAAGRPHRAERTRQRLEIYQNANKA
jgi:hypothetical protein